MMVKKPHLCMKSINWTSKVAYYGSEKCERLLNEIPISIEWLVGPMDFLVAEKTP